MAASVHGAITRLTCFSPDHLVLESSFTQLCADGGYLWRDRLLGPLVTLRLFLLQSVKPGRELMPRS